MFFYQFDLKDQKKLELLEKIVSTNFKRITAAIENYSNSQKEEADKQEQDRLQAESDAQRLEQEESQATSEKEKQLLTDLIQDCYAGDKPDFSNFAEVLSEQDTISLSTKNSFTHQVIMQILEDYFKNTKEKLLGDAESDATDLETGITDQKSLIKAKKKIEKKEDGRYKKQLLDLDSYEIRKIIVLSMLDTFKGRSPKDLPEEERALHRSLNEELVQLKKKTGNFKRLRARAMNFIKRKAPLLGKLISIAGAFLGVATRFTTITAMFAPLGPLAPVVALVVCTAMFFIQRAIFGLAGKVTDAIVEQLFVKFVEDKKDTRGPLGIICRKLANERAKSTIKIIVRIITVMLIAKPTMNAMTGLVQRASEPMMRGLESIGITSNMAPPNLEGNLAQINQYAEGQIPASEVTGGESLDSLVSNNPAYAGIEPVAGSSFNPMEMTYEEINAYLASNTQNGVQLGSDWAREAVKQGADPEKIAQIRYAVNSPDSVANSITGQGPLHNLSLSRSAPPSPAEVAVTTGSPQLVGSAPESFGNLPSFPTAQETLIANTQNNLIQNYMNQGWRDPNNSFGQFVLDKSNQMRGRAPPFPQGTNDWNSVFGQNTLENLRQQFLRTPAGQTLIDRARDQAALQHATLNLPRNPFDPRIIAAARNNNQFGNL
jgi:hypothetical protein